MANSTFRQTVDKILILSGQSPIGTSSGDFDSNTLDKPQQQAKLITDFANRQLALVNHGRFMRRRYVFTTDPVANPTGLYALDASTSIERLVRESWMDFTNSQPLDWRGFHEFQTMYPVLIADLPKGKPMYWTDSTPASGDDSGISHVQLTPVPDGAYLIQYYGFLKTAALENETDEIIWPVEFEHLLWTAAISIMEVVLSEGKSANYQAMLEPAISQVKQLSIGPPDEIPGLDLQIEICQSRRGAYYIWNSQP